MSIGNVHDETKGRGSIEFAISLFILAALEPNLKIISYGIAAKEKMKKMAMSILICRQ
jgi:hypothetical protein